MKFLKEQSSKGILSKDENNIPFVACWRVDYACVGFYCTFCKRVHLHGWSDGDPDGHRSEHCPEKNDLFSNGYHLVCKGDISEGVK